MPHIQKITLQGFKSIKSLENFTLGPLNVFIGANGAGKSNFLEFFSMLQAMCGFSLPELPVSGLRNYVSVHGGCERLLFLGTQGTKEISCAIETEEKTYALRFLPTSDENLALAMMHDGSIRHDGQQKHGEKTTVHVSEEDCRYKKEFYNFISSVKHYHFNNTYLLANVRKSSLIPDTQYLRPDGSNLASMLWHIRETSPRDYKEIFRSIYLVAPYIEEFCFTMLPGERVRHDWKRKNSSYVFLPAQLSDGTLRYITLATLLLQPKRPDIIFIDEPELGLHPGALPLLAEMIEVASQESQIIISTQSATLLDYFPVNDVIVAECTNGESTFSRLSSDTFRVWLEKYSLGDLWKKDVIQTSPVYV